jgi:hypothetical protein
MTTNAESCSRLTSLRVRQVVKEWASQTKRFAETGCSGEGCPVRLENYCAADGTPSEPVGNTLYACTERRIPCAVKNRSTSYCEGLKSGVRLALSSTHHSAAPCRASCSCATDTFARRPKMASPSNSQPHKQALGSPIVALRLGQPFPSKKSKAA